MQVDLAYRQFLEGWQQIMIIAAIVSIITAFVILLIHYIKFSAVKTYKGKYDYLKLNRIRAYQFFYFSLAAGMFFFGNTLGDTHVEKSLIYIFVRIFISMCVGVLIGYIIYLILKA